MLSLLTYFIIILNEIVSQVILLQLPLEICWTATVSWKADEITCKIMVFLRWLFWSRRFVYAYSGGIRKCSWPLLTPNFALFSLSLPFSLLHVLHGCSQNYRFLAQILSDTVSYWPFHGHLIFRILGFYASGFVMIVISLDRWEQFLR